MASFLNEALKYARAGFRVVILHGVDPRTNSCTCRKGAACNDTGKHPREGRWTQTATTDEREIRRLFSKYPRSNVGVMPKEGTVVVDVDPRNGGDASGLGLPKRTPTQRTGGGGAHYIVRIPDGAALPKLRGIDYRFPGRHQIVVAPSIHKSGAAYRWARGLSFEHTPALWRPQVKVDQADVGATGLAPIPLSRTARLDLDALRGFGLVVASRAPDRWGAGQHDAWLHEWLMPVHFETGGSSEGLALAHEISQRFSGYDANALEAKWRSLGKANRSGTRTGATLARIVTGLLSPAMQKLPDSLLETRDASALAHKKLPALNTLVEGLVTAGLMLISGPPKIGKSWLMLDLLLAMGRGDSFWGHGVLKPCNVLYLALEDNERRLQARLAQLRQEGAGDAAFKYALTAPRINQGLDDHLEAEIRVHGYDAIVIDSLAMIRPLDEKQRLSAWQSDYQHTRPLKELADKLNVAVIVITHNSKQGSQGGAAQNAISATGGLMAGVDGWWVLEHLGKQTAAEEPIVKLTVEHRDLSGGESAITFDRRSARWRMLGPVAEVVRGGTQAGVIEALRTAPRGLTTKQIAEATGKPVTAIAMCLTRLRRDGIVSTTDGRNRLVS